MAAAVPQRGKAQLSPRKVVACHVPSDPCKPRRWPRWVLFDNTGGVRVVDLQEFFILGRGATFSTRHVCKERKVEHQRWQHHRNEAVVP